jgi:SAM-dependent methyltransferase
LRRIWTPPPDIIDFGRTEPSSTEYGFDRGLPIDRYIVKGFLAHNDARIDGRVLEIGGNGYTLRFGGKQVGKSDVLHVEVANAVPTIVGDIANPRTLPERALDCIVQTLQLIFDMRWALAELGGALRPGGKLLVAGPGISPVDRSARGHTWFWSLTKISLGGLLALVFGEKDAEVETFGNAFAATCVLQGFALSEGPPANKPGVLDKSFPIIFAAAARRPFG